MPKRRRGAQSAPRHGRPVRHASFAALVEHALAGIPEPFQAALDEVAVVVEDEPSPSQRRDNELSPDETLYGLYEGVPKTAWASDWQAVPNKISLFRLALEEDFPDPEDLADEVRHTVIHELAHHLGIDDERLHELGVD
jgi:predicted Zn-dependent protease with MMP-like domain